MDDFAPRLSFFFNAQIDFFEEIAKFRAARRLWARIMKERFGAKDPKSMMCRFHVQTAGSSLTAQQVDNNVVRTAVEALAAVLGGTQSLHTNARDEALALPTEDSVQLALRTQQLIAYETGVTENVDPLGGSYYVESLTKCLEEEAEKLIGRIDDLGGAVTAIEKGFIQNEIGRSAYEYQKRIDLGRRSVVGVNRFMAQDSEIPATLFIDTEAVASQVNRTKAFKSDRDPDDLRAARKTLQEAAAGDDNLMPHIILAAKSGATLGEISDTLRQVFGEYDLP